MTEDEKKLLQAKHRMEEAQRVCGANGGLCLRRYAAVERLQQNRLALVLRRSGQAAAA